MIKAGDIVYYQETRGAKFYCRCVAVTELSGYNGTKQVWGKWSSDLNIINEQPFINEPNPRDKYYNYMEIEKVFIYKQSLKQLLNEVEE